MQQETLTKWYQRLIENPYQIFMVMPDGQIVDHQGIYDIANVDDGTFSLCELSVIPGSFNPLHSGHRFMYDNMPGFQLPDGSKKKAFEISLRRIGKPDLSIDELSSRLRQFEFYAPVIITNAPRFIEKCGCMPVGVDIVWHIGIDTVLRMRDDYGELGFSGLQGSFIVWDRDLNDGKGIQKYPLDFEVYPRNVHRCHVKFPKELVGISSTKLRNSLINHE